MQNNIMKCYIHKYNIIKSECEAECSERDRAKYKSNRQQCSMLGDDSVKAARNAAACNHMI
jgi:hypothetical protein